LQKGNEFATSDEGKETLLANSAGMDLEMLKNYYQDKAEAVKIGVELKEYLEAKRLGTLA
jgi:hypothetical protein